MPVITKRIAPDERGSEVTEIHKALASLGAHIDTLELASGGNEGKLGGTTIAELRRLLVRFGFEVMDEEGNFLEIVFNASLGRLLHIAVAAEKGNTADLKIAVNEAFDVIQVPPVAAGLELSWLARYATIARDFTLANRIVQMLPHGFPTVESIVGNNAQAQVRPELLNPENYYTFLYDFVARQTIQLMDSGAAM